MKTKNKYKEQLLKIKCLLKKIYTEERIYNHILLKLRKCEYDTIIDRYIDFFNDSQYALFYEISHLRMYDKKNRNESKHRMKIYNLKKNMIIEKIRIVKNYTFTIRQINSMLENLNNSDIEKFNKYYYNFINIFSEIDKHIDSDSIIRITSAEYQSKYSTVEHFGLGMVIRNEYIYKNLDKNVENIFYNKNDSEYLPPEPDDISAIILIGYRYYKLGIFNVFNY